MGSTPTGILSAAVGVGFNKAQRASRPDVLQARIQRSAVQVTLQEAKLRHDAGWK